MARITFQKRQKEMKRQEKQRMKAEKPDLMTAEVPGVGHAPSLVEPDALAAIEALLAKVDARERELALA